MKQKIKFVIFIEAFMLLIALILYGITKINNIDFPKEIIPLLMSVALGGCLLVFIIAPIAEWWFKD